MNPYGHLDPNKFFANLDRKRERGEEISADEVKAAVYLVAAELGTDPVALAQECIANLGNSDLSAFDAVAASAWRAADDTETAAAVAAAEQIVNQAQRRGRQTRRGIA